VHIGQGHITFDWTATHHFAAVDYLRRNSKPGLLAKSAPVVVLLCALLFLGFTEGDFSYERVTELLWSLVPIAILSAIFWTIFISEAGRRLLFSRRPGIPCALRFDERGITVAIGKSPLSYPWAKVRSIGEDAEYLFVVASRSTCFAIPKTAFGNPLEAEQFATTMRQLLEP
jgi:hypothetical protein